MNRNGPRTSRAILSVTALLGLAACGGGGGSSPPLTMDGAAATVSLGVGVDRDHASTPNTSALLADAGMPMVRRTDRGFDISVGGRTVAFTGDHHGEQPRFPDAYYREDDPDEAHFLLPWQENAAYDYTELYTWNVTEIDRSPMTAEALRSDTVWFVQGAPTHDMPVSGSATYAGFVRAWAWSQSAASVLSNSPSTTNYSGSFRMTARFGPSGTGVTGEFADLTQWAGNAARADATPVPGRVTFATTADGNRLSIDRLSGSGPLAGYENISVKAGFFGPAAAEVGGVFQGENPTRSTVLTGAFAGKKR